MSEHKTQTITDRRTSKPYTATCSCGWTSNPSHNPQIARHHAKAHKQDSKAK
jgi:hypothetical protein